MGGFPTAGMSRLEGDRVISKLLQAVTLGWSVGSLGQNTMQSALWTHALGLIFAHRLEGAKTKFKFSV
jgi:hypothetical protein